MRTVLVTRPDGAALAERLRALGMETKAIPTVAITSVAGGPLDEAVRSLGAYDWVVVTSANGARALGAALARLGLSIPPRPRWAAVGPATAEALDRIGARPSAVPARHVGVAIADALGDVQGLRVLLPRADAAPGDLPRALRERGAAVDEVVAYRTVEAPASSRAALRRALAAGVDAIVFASPSAVRGFARLAAPGALRGPALVCIGPVTAEAVRALGVEPAVVAEEHTAEGLIAALARLVLTP